MSKRKIEAALKRKGLKCDELYFDRQIPVPEEIVSGWVIYLSELSILMIDEMSFKDDVDYDTQPDCSNTEEVLEWIDTLPDCRDLEFPEKISEK